MYTLVRIFKTAGFDTSIIFSCNNPHNSIRRWFLKNQVLSVMEITQDRFWLITRYCPSKLRVSPRLICDYYLQYKCRGMLTRGSKFSASFGAKNPARSFPCSPRRYRRDGAMLTSKKCKQEYFKNTSLRERFPCLLLVFDLGFQMTDSRWKPRPLSSPWTCDRWGGGGKIEVCVRGAPPFSAEISGKKGAPLTRAYMVYIFC